MYMHCFADLLCACNLAAESVCGQQLVSVILLVCTYACMGACVGHFRFRILGHVMCVIYVGARAHLCVPRVCLYAGCLLPTDMKGKGTSRDSPNNVNILKRG